MFPYRGPSSEWISRIFMPILTETFGNERFLSETNMVKFSTRNIQSFRSYDAIKSLPRELLKLFYFKRCRARSDFKLRLTLVRHFCWDRTLNLASIRFFTRTLSHNSEKILHSATLIFTFLITGTKYKKPVRTKVASDFELQNKKKLSATS